MIDIDVQSRIPIYKQIYNQIETLALNGVYEPNAQLMSVRQLAKLVGINPNTIIKAYSELEQNGIIYSVPGRGSFVSPNLVNASEQKRREILSELENTAHVAASLGISENEAINAVKNAYDNSSGVIK